MYVQAIHPSASSLAASDLLGGGSKGRRAPSSLFRVSVCVKGSFLVLLLLLFGDGVGRPPRPLAFTPPKGGGGGGALPPFLKALLLSPSRPFARAGRRLSSCLQTTKTRRKGFCLALFSSSLPPPSPLHLCSSKGTGLIKFVPRNSMMRMTARSFQKTKTGDNKDWSAFRESLLHGTCPLREVGGENESRIFLPPPSPPPIFGLPSSSLCWLQKKVEKAVLHSGKGKGGEEKCDSLPPRSPLSTSSKIY